MRFPPGIGKWQLEQSGYLNSSPQLVGTVHSFAGDDADHRAMLETLAQGGDWTAGQRTTQVALAPAACYGVYPAVAARGRLPEEGALVDCYTWCFRHEPSIDPARMQMFRQREHVRLGSEEQALAFREKWKERGQAIIGSFGLPFEVDIANDPFFGRTGRLLAASQREESLKFELLVPIHAKEHPTACVSFNYHRDLFGRAWKIETASGATAHTACVGFGVERITLALLKHHGLAVDRWPSSVRDVLGL
jgi:seryl-tRNA synthetase